MLNEASERALSPQTLPSNDFSPREVGAEGGALRRDASANADNNEDSNIAFTPPPEVSNMTGSARGGSSSVTHDRADRVAEGARKSRSWRTLLGLHAHGAESRGSEGGSAREQERLIKRWNVALVEEARLNEMERRIAAGDSTCDVLHEAPNFPPRFLCLAPLVHHDFGIVPAHRRRFVQLAFWTWVALCVLLVANMAIVIGTLYAPVRRDIRVDDEAEHKARSVVLAVVYLVGIPLAFLLWYWRIYRASVTHMPGEYVAAMCGMLLGFAQAIFAVIGPTGYGVCGVLFATYIARTRRVGVVAPIAVMCFLWLLLAIVLGILAVRLITFFRRDRHAGDDPIQ